MTEFETFEDFVASKKEQGSTPEEKKEEKIPEENLPEIVIEDHETKKEEKDSHNQDEFRKAYWAMKELERLKSEGRIIGEVGKRMTVNKEQEKLKEEVEKLKEDKFETTINELNDKARKMLEEGQFIEYDKIKTEIYDKQLKKAKKEIKKELKQRENGQVPQEYFEDSNPISTIPQVQPQISIEAQNFINRNASWFNSSQAFRDKAIEIEQSLLRDPYYASNHNALYSEVEVRMAQLTRPSTPQRKISNTGVEGVTNRTMMQNNQGQIKLTPEEARFITEKVGSHLSPSQALETYKKFKTENKQFSLYELAQRSRK